MNAEKKLKYKYLPDVRYIMEQAGYNMGLEEILDEQIKSGNMQSLSNIQNSETHNRKIFVPEIFIYDSRDINGKTR